MEYINMFPTPVYVALESDLRNNILPVAEEYINLYGAPFRNQKNYISTYGVELCYSKLYSDARINQLTNCVKEAYAKYFDDHCIDYQKWKLRVEYLFNRMTSGGEHVLHSHPDSILSGVFYLKVPKNSSSIIFNDPREYYKYKYYPQKFGKSREHYKLLPEYVINPVEGMMLLWPSWLEHQVPASLCSEERIAVAFNIS